MAARVLILASTTGYQTRIFEAAARRLGLEPVMATDRCHHLADPWGDSALPVRFTEPEAGAQLLSQLNPRPSGIIAVGDRPTEIASLAAERLGLRYHPPAGVTASRNKFLARERFRQAGLKVPAFRRVPVHTDPGKALAEAEFPCVLKPLGLSGSRGVIRANSDSEFLSAFERIRAILEQPDIRREREEQADFIQIESWIPGREFALEGLVREGALRVLALFDKPDPLDGPFFEETIYVTPSRETAETQKAIESTTQAAVTALGLTDGPIHAEMRVNECGVWMLEVAARPIGGLCAQALRFSEGISFEEVLLRFALGEDVTRFRREKSASAVMMIPIPAAGIYRSVYGIEEARRVPCITEIVITAKDGQTLLPLPEGASYLGFIFARAETPEQAEAALRDAHGQLRFEIMQELPAMRPA